MFRRKSSKSAKKWTISFLQKIIFGIIYKLNEIA